MDEGHQHLRHRARDRRGVHRPIAGSCATSAASCRGSFRDVPFARARQRSHRRLSRQRRGRRARPRRRSATGRRTAAIISYNKTALWLHTLERHLGWPTMQRIMATYFERWKFRHPQPADFFRIVNEVSGQDLTWFFDQVYRSSNTFDYGVQELVSERPRRGRVSGRRSVVQRATARPRSRWTSSRRSPTASRSPSGGTGSTGARSTSTSGRRARRRVQVDPRRVLLLDINLHQQQPDARAAQRRGQPEVGADVDGLAAGPDGHLCVLSSDGLGGGVGSRCPAAARSASTR